ncbi:Ig-like domain-containing protein [Armatimonas rosea]|uniref:BIG2 domain-containing protein n=1 Tax=Armatimonas rosea TaxID=685828 RepID=A0A7W9SQY6_ARMRO|nr:Ig-like domain-containing protein [Armatimonas rosea]MBB6051200.1 hypothetical protein [Armatimonas rosea]
MRYRVGAVLPLVFLAGCGGVSAPLSDAATGRGKIAFTIVWPQPTASRLIPLAANSIKVELSGPTPDVKVIARPPAGTTTTDVSFPSQVVGDYTIVASAYPTSDGTGTAQALGVASVTVTKDQVVDARLTMASTIVAARISPTSGTVKEGETLSLTGSGQDATGAAVVTANEKWTWTSSNPAAATVSATGNPATVTGVLAGSTVITGRELESGKSRTATVTVLPGVGNLELTVK